MNKQQLAAKIWESANQMRSKIEANEYKDYILGFIFYKYLSDQLAEFVKKEGMTEEDIKALTEEDAETVKYIQDSRRVFHQLQQPVFHLGRSRIRLRRIQRARCALCL